MNNLSIRKGNELLKKKKKGFTLVELIIVIAIIAILAAMAIPKLSAVRIDAKVSNDVAAAKNIQTQVAMGIANSTVAVPTADKVVDADILAKLDGNAKSGNAEALSGGAFHYVVDSKGGIKVSVVKGSDTFILYPEETGTERKSYATAAVK